MAVYKIHLPEMTLTENDIALLASRIGDNKIAMKEILVLMIQIGKHKSAA